MSEDGNNRQFAIQRIYTKDVSFEVPNAPQVFTAEWKPSINVQLNTSVQDLGEDHYELVLNVTVTAKQGDKTGFLAEVQQAGIFLISGIAEPEMGPMLGIFCPNILFPYAREAVSDLVNRGSFPQLNLAPVNFEALYAQQVQQQQAGAGDPSH
jgi:preprotein translocase subunit SecB